MGRGLSNLQKWILLGAAKKGAQGLSNAEIFTGYYKWNPGDYMPKGRNFIPDGSIGRNSYNSAHVAVKKSCDRLVARGLVERTWNFEHSCNGVVITEAGISVAKHLTETPRQD